MYNLLVTGKSDAWDAGIYEYDKSRFLEYTNDEIAARFKELKSRQLSSLKKFPCLFAYEADYAPARVGKITDIRDRGHSLVIEFELDQSLPPINLDKADAVKLRLDIRGWEMNRTHWAVKDAQLMETLRKHELIPQRTAIEADKEPLPAAPDNVSIGSVEDFIREVLNRAPGEREFFYRGHTKSTYRLEPSLFRKDKAGNYTYRDCEEKLYRELLVSNSTDFQGDVYTLDKLVRMQHYSLPTRLLDITSNPLIALFFACKNSQPPATDDEDSSSEVISFAISKSSIKYFDSDTASCIANLARLPQADKAALDFSSSNINEFNEQAPIRRLLHFIKEEKSFFESRIDSSDLRKIICVKGKRSNNRITFQSGAFLLFGHEAVLSESGAEDIEVQRIRIVNQKSIISQLDVLNINESTVFPYIENSARYIAAKNSFIAPSADELAG
ncbi:MAG: FRG domain-containing protein [Pseudacidovorax sp.]|nr:FRG domain-containing protein [Pseudacidovorax sp.]